MKAILMVCLGNICRSPLAEGILRDKVEKLQLNVRIDSAGTSNYHIGSNPDKRSVNNAKKHGIDISKLVGRQFTVKDFDEFDIIFVMDNSNYKNVISLARNSNDKQKVKLILNSIFPGENRDVPDPYYDEEMGFENVFQLLDKACHTISTSLKEHKQETKNG